MAFKIFLAYGFVIIIFLSIALANGWKFDLPSGSSVGGYGSRDSSGSWGWGGGK